MISPIIEKGKTERQVYLPAKSDWYDFYDGHRVQGGWSTVQSSLDDEEPRIPLHVSGGYVIPMQWPGVTTEESRKNNMGLLVALEDKNAAGEIYIDDGESIDAEKDNFSLIKFEVHDDSMTGFAEVDNYKDIVFKLNTSHHQSREFLFDG